MSPGLIWRHETIQQENPSPRLRNFAGDNAVSNPALLRLCHPQLICAKTANSLRKSNSWSAPASPIKSATGRAAAWRPTRMRRARRGDAYPVTSLYLDTERFDVFHRKGSFGRSKYRVRRYGQSEIAFLERKLKTRGLLTKRRSIVKPDELEHLASDDPERGWAGYWFHRRLLARGLE